MNFNRLIQIIKDFEENVFFIEKLFRHQYNLSMSPLLASTQKIIPKQGQLNYQGRVIYYAFHGIGCRVEINSVILDYDYYGKDFLYEAFGSWKLFEFIESSGDKYGQCIDKILFFKLIEGLEAEGIIEKINPPYALYKLVTQSGRSF